MATELSGFTVYVRPELLDALKAQAVREGRTLSNYVARTLEGLWHPQEGFPLIPDRMVHQHPPRAFVEDAGPAAARQVHLEDAIAAAVMKGPVGTAVKQAQHRKNIAARSARMTERVSKHK